jgi:hypothetical protein
MPECGERTGALARVTGWLPIQKGLGEGIEGSRKEPHV